MNDLNKNEPYYHYVAQCHVWGIGRVGPLTVLCLLPESGHDKPV